MNQMVTRCIACNCRLSNAELESCKEDGSIEDMCQECLNSIYEEE